VEAARVRGVRGSGGREGRRRGDGELGERAGG